MPILEKLLEIIVKSVNYSSYKVEFRNNIGMHLVDKNKKLKNFLPNQVFFGNLCFSFITIFPLTEKKREIKREEHFSMPV